MLPMNCGMAAMGRWEIYSHDTVCWRFAKEEPDSQAFPGSGGALRVSHSLWVSLSQACNLVGEPFPSMCEVLELILQL